MAGRSMELKQDPSAPLGSRAPHQADVRSLSTTLAATLKLCTDLCSRVAFSHTQSSAISTSFERIEAWEIGLERLRAGCEKLDSFLSRYEGEATALEADVQSLKARMKHLSTTTSTSSQSSAKKGTAPHGSNSLPEAIEVFNLASALQTKADLILSSVSSAKAEQEIESILSAAPGQATLSLASKQKQASSSNNYLSSTSSPGALIHSSSALVALDHRRRMAQSIAIVGASQLGNRAACQQVDATRVLEAASRMVKLLRGAQDELPPKIDKLLESNGYLRAAEKTIHAVLSSLDIALDHPIESEGQDEGKAHPPLLVSPMFPAIQRSTGCRFQAESLRDMARSCKSSCDSLKSSLEKLRSSLSSLSIREAVDSFDRLKGQVPQVLRQIKEVEAEARLLEAQAFSATATSTKKKGTGSLLPSSSPKSSMDDPSRLPKNRSAYSLNPLGSKSVCNSPVLPSSPLRVRVGMKTALAWGEGNEAHSDDSCPQSPVNYGKTIPQPRLPSLPAIKVEA